MSEHLEISAGSKREKYEALLPQIEAVVAAESDPIANMANVASMLHETFGFWWTGFYRVLDDMLVLGPFQGPMACTRIRKGRGVCGTAWQSRSEIVVPLHNASGEVTGVLDIDSAELNTFDETDRIYLEQVANLFH